MTLFELRRLCRLWKARLSLSNWTITAAFGTDEGNAGEAPYEPRERTATVHIQQGLADSRYADNGLEVTVIHELLHLVLHGHTDYKREDIHQERAINDIANALYVAYRGRKR